MSSLEAKLRTAAAANVILSGYLGTSPFRWFDGILAQGASFPAVVAQDVSNPASYAVTGLLPTSYSRMQLTVWDTDATRGRAVEDAIAVFLNTFAADGISGRVACPSMVVASRGLVYSQPEPIRYLRIIDAQIFNNVNT